MGNKRPIRSKAMLLAVFLLSSSLLFSQEKSPKEKIDSLNAVLKVEKEDTAKVNTLDAIANEFADSDKNKALDYLTQALSLAQQLNFKKGIAISYRRRGYVYNHLNNFNEAVKNNQLAVPYFKEIGDQKHVAWSFEAIAADYMAQGLYAEAIDNEFEAMKSYEKMDDTLDLANEYQNVGAIYMEENNDSESLKYLQIGLNLREKINDKLDIPQSLATIGKVHTDLGNFDLALDEDSAAFKLYLAQGKEARPWGIILCRIAIGDNYEKLGERETAAKDKPAANTYFEKALQNYLPALEFWRREVAQTKRDENLDWIYNKIGLVQLGLGKIPEAKKSFMVGLQMATNEKSKENLRDSYHGLAMIDSIEGNYKEAFEQFQQYIRYRDSLTNEESVKKMTQRSMQFDFDKKEAAEKADQEKKDIETKKEKNIQYFAIGALALIVLAVALIAGIQYRSSRQRKKANFLLQQQKEKIESTLTDLKSAQSQLIQSEKMASLGELTAGIAHEIQNPLNFVNNFSEVNRELLSEMNDEMEKGDLSAAKRLAADIVANEEKINHHGKRADAIVKGMLQHSRSGSGTKELTNIVALADEFLRLAFHGMRAKEKDFQATIKTDFEDSMIMIHVFPQDIGRVLLNLYSNAFYATSERRKTAGSDYEPMVCVNVKKLHEKVILSVADNGTGIPHKFLDKIFQPFFTTKPTGQGTGLGLSLSYDIIKAHGGEINVNVKENEGTEFIIALPLK